MSDIFFINVICIFTAIRNNQTLSELTDISLPAISAPPVPHPAANHSQSNHNQYENQCKQEGADKDWTEHISTEEGQMLIEALNGFVIVVQQDGQIFYVSTTIREYLGFQEADVMHQCVYELIHKDDRLAFQQQMSVDPIDEESEGMSQELQPATQNHDFGDNIVRSFECRFRCLLDESSGFLKLKFSGKLRPLHGQRVRGKDGIPIDKDPPELALFALACPVEQYSIVEIHIRNTIFRTKHDLSFKPLAADKMGVEVLGYSEMELIQLPGYHYIHYEDLIYLSDIHSNLLRKGETGYCYFRLYRKTGKWMWVQVKPRVIYKNDQPDYLVSTHRPMSDQEGEQHHKQRENPFKFPFKNIQSPLYDMNNPYPPMPREIIEYIKSGFKPQFGKEGGPPIDFGAMGPPPKGAGPPNAAKQPLNGGMQPRNGLGSRPPKSMMPESVMRPGMTANRVDTIKSFVGPDGVQNTIMQTQITRCANQIQKLKIPDQFNVEYTRSDMMHAAPMITDLTPCQQMGADPVGITGSSEVVFGQDTIPTFNETIMPLERLTEIPTQEPLSCQVDQSCQFSNADVPKTSTTVSCMQGPNQSFVSKDMMMFQTAMETGSMNQKNHLSFPNNSLSNNVNFEQCPMVENSLQHPGESNLLPGVNCVQKTGVATTSKLHDMLTKPTHNVHHHSNLLSGTSDMKRERTHTVEYLPNGSQLATPAQQAIPSSLHNIQTNQLTEQGRLMQSAQYHGIPPVVPMNNQQVFGTVGENSGFFQPKNGVSAMENQMTMICGGQNMTNVGNQSRMNVGNQYGIAPGSHELNSCGINQIPNNNQFVNGMGIMGNENQRNMRELNSGYQHMMNDGNPGMMINGGNQGMMMTGNQRMINHGTGIVQNQRMVPTRNMIGTQQGMMNARDQQSHDFGNHQGLINARSQGMLGTGNQHGMMNVMNQGIADTGSHQGIVNARNQGISNMGDHQEMMISSTQGIPATANYQRIINARNHGITNTGSHPGMMSASNQGIPNSENHHPGLMNACNQGILGTANQMGMVNARNQGIPNPENRSIPNVAYQGMGNIANQSLMYSDNQVMGGTYPARSQQEILEMLSLSGNNIEHKGNNLPTVMARNVKDGQNQQVFLGNEQMTAKDAMMYSMIQKQLQTPNNQGMDGNGYINQGMMYCENDMQANALNQEMEARNTRVPGEAMHRHSTDSGSTGYESSQLSSVFDDYCSSTGMQLTPNSVFSSPSGKSGSPGDSCELLY
ncbi:uncharacterized protein LOC117119765 [Anneissia japonica]|uniref:uncharacterized protein LOC117119765 n=1 Tax=Anneissia japonica TaxID=1529436 RepID=UPI0014257D33|nr:uncharacterized protein LOC117119765 [Anneissia japonica]